MEREYHYEIGESAVFNALVDYVIVQKNQCLQQFIKLHTDYQLQRILIQSFEPVQETHNLLRQYRIYIVMFIYPLSPSQYRFLHHFLLFHSREFRLRFLFLLNILCLLLVIILHLLLILLSRFFILLFELIHCHSRYLCQLKPEIDLHHVLDGVLRLRYEHVEEQHLEELSALFALLTSREREFKDGLQNEWRHELVKECSRFVHLVAFADNARQYLEQLLCPEVILEMMIQCVDAVLKDPKSELFVVIRT